MKMANAVPGRSAAIAWRARVMPAPPSGGPSTIGGSQSTAAE
ncbi:hypothetical protein [Actinoplanes sp. M2I2]|nr:hypothetical protein [Actinoplanes sp. M2I2]